MNVSAAFRQCLIELDVDGIRTLWKHVSPHLPQPKTGQDALVALHMARTAADTVGFRLRAYSHSWLLERGYPSGLPDHLRPKAERMYPRIVDAVGIAVKVPAHRAGLGQRIQAAMSEAVLKAYADKRTDPEFVKARMMEARQRQLRQE